MKNPAQCLFLGLSGKIRIQLVNRRFEATLKDDIGVALAFGDGFVRRDVRTVEDGPVQRLEPTEGELFNVRFADSFRHYPVLAFFFRACQISSALVPLRPSWMAAIAFCEYLLKTELPIRNSL